jgi:hypothetical protein
MYRDGLKPLMDKLGAMPLRRLTTANVRSVLVYLAISPAVRECSPQGGRCTPRRPGTGAPGQPADRYRARS